MSMRHLHHFFAPSPDDLERRVDTALGPLLVRPIRPEDAPAHEAFFAALSPQDIHFRMFGTMRALSPAQPAGFTQIDYAREMAFIATRPGLDGTPETLGVVRVAIDPDGIAGEFAIVVRSDLHGHGLGRLLMDHLLDYCRARGLARVCGVALADNVDMHRLARACGFQLLPAVDGNVEMVLTLTQAG